jgi:hypothetical protein
VIQQSGQCGCGQDALLLASVFACEGWARVAMRAMSFFHMLAVAEFLQPCFRSCVGSKDSRT